MSLKNFKASKLHGSLCLPPTPDGPNDLLHHDLSKAFLKKFLSVVKASFFVFWSNWRSGKSGAGCPEIQEQQIFLEGSSQLYPGL